MTKILRTQERGFMNKTANGVPEKHSSLFPGKFNHLLLAEQILDQKPILNKKIQENCLIEETSVKAALSEVVRFLNLIVYSEKKLTPGKTIDLVWHEFILSTRAYEEFCRQAFGSFLHHTPAEAMKQTRKGSEGVKRTWRGACEREGLYPRKPERLPRLFSLDADLDIPNGFKYSLDCKWPGSHPYCGSHIGCSGGSGGTGDSVGNPSSFSETGGDSFGFGCSSSCGGGCGGGD